MLRLAFRTRHRVFQQNAPITHRRRVVSDSVDGANFDNSPLVRLIQKRMQHRQEIESQIKDDTSPDDRQKFMKALSETDTLFMEWQEWQRTRELLNETRAMLQDPDPSMQAMAQEEYTTLNEKLNASLETTFPKLLVPASEDTSKLSAYIELKAGVGGSEATLFVDDLMRMYLRLALSMNWTASVVSSSEVDGGGFRDAILEIRGLNAYDTLRWESGVHRVQRVPATETKGRTHTSTVAVIVLPISEDEAAAETNNELYSMADIRIEVMRSRGAGGQHVNKTESAVRLTHIPTGITVSMQDERSQHQNRRRAFRILQARLLDRKLTQDVIDRRDARRDLVKSADRSEKIRTYNYAQNRVTDHRLGLSVKNITAVMEGEALKDILDGLVRQHEANLLESVLADVD
ncbi:peptide chain release factor 1 [Cristinia sonorae]|uniref:Peptide chain release factor 1 n=1 Tax=Cristinia sonorae TaxID=1940300 RepID=A0A8K0UWW4_9AGAR|nr:peptide chain release factor 1 [Cristinia sonorae]